MEGWPLNHLLLEGVCNEYQVPDDYMGLFVILSLLNSAIHIFIGIVAALLLPCASPKRQKEESPILDRLWLEEDRREGGEDHSGLTEIVNKM